MDEERTKNFQNPYFYTKLDEQLNKKTNLNNYERALKTDLFNFSIFYRVRKLNKSIVPFFYPKE